jgi:hypothetical protein
LLDQIEYDYIKGLIDVGVNQNVVVLDKDAPSEVITPRHYQLLENVIKSFHKTDETINKIIVNQGHLSDYHVDLFLAAKKQLAANIKETEFDINLYYEKDLKAHIPYDKSQILIAITKSGKVMLGAY